MSQAIFCILSEFFGYADDGGDVIHGDSKESCNKAIKLVLEQRVKWFRNIGLALNPKKTELMGFNFIPDQVTIGDVIINPKSEITFLGVKIQSDLKWTSHVSSLCAKIRGAAGRIRSDGRHLRVSEKRILYQGWIQGLIHSNGLAYLPTLNKSELHDIQTAMNAGIRSIVGLPRYGHAEITALRHKLNLPSIIALKDRIVAVAAWSRFAETTLEQEFCGPTTRARKNRNLPLTDQRGHAGKISTSFLVKAWNELPLSVKNLRSKNTVKSHIKKMFI